MLRFPVETSSIATCSKARHFCSSVGNYCFWTMAADCFPKHLSSCRCLLFLDVSGSFLLILRRISTRCLLFASIYIDIHFRIECCTAPARIASQVFMSKVNRCFFCGLFNSQWKKHKDDGSFSIFFISDSLTDFCDWLCSQSTLWLVSSSQTSIGKNTGRFPRDEMVDFWKACTGN